MIILVDMDGVLTDYHGGLGKELKRRGMWVPAKEQLKYFVYTDNCPVEYGEVIRTIQNQKGFTYGLEPIPGGKEALEKMTELGHKVRICTAPFGEHQITLPEKLAWAESNLGKEWSKNVIITRDKTLVKGHVLIDDKPIIEGITNPVWEHILYTQSYNKDIKDKRRLTWDNWRKVLEI